MKISLKRKRIWLILSVSVILVVMAGCSAGEDKPLVFADAGWDSIQFHNYVAGFIIENGLGYQTEVMPGTTPITFAGLQRGDIDLYMEIWQDNIGEAYKEAIEQGDINVLGVNFDDNEQGLWVPTYMLEGDPERGIEPMAPDLKSIFDLPQYWELFKDPEQPGKGRIVGSPAGWVADEILSTKMVSYGLEDSFNYFRPGSDSALAASIAGAYEKGEPWVGYYWTPTWVMGKYDMTLLEEPEYSEEKWQDGFQCAFPASEITIAVHKDVPERAPEVAEFLSRYQTNSALISEVLSYMTENDTDAQQAAIYFLKEYENIWSDWVSEDVAEKVKAALP
ncbi:MAG: ABC transporter substrate-binding protein [Bacillota bacterium]|nr:ABC transporter substrate-binding protein [Bacillota bacterium]